MKWSSWALLFSLVNCVCPWVSASAADAAPVSRYELLGKWRRVYNHWNEIKGSTNYFPLAQILEHFHADMEDIAVSVMPFVSCNLPPWNIVPTTRQTLGSILYRSLPSSKVLILTMSPMFITLLNQLWLPATTMQNYSLVTDTIFKVFFIS